MFLIVLIFGDVDISNPSCPYQSAGPPLRYSQVHPNDAQICQFAHLTPTRENGRWGTLDSRPKWFLKILVIIILQAESQPCLSSVTCKIIKVITNRTLRTIPLKYEPLSNMIVHVPFLCNRLLNLWFCFKSYLIFEVQELFEHWIFQNQLQSPPSRGSGWS